MLKALVQDLRARPDVLGVAVISADGLLIERALPTGMDPEAIAAIGITLVRHARELGGAAVLGEAGALVSEFAGGAVLLSPAGDHVSHVMVLARPDTDLGELLYALRRQRPEFAAQL